MIEESGLVSIVIPCYRQDQFLAEAIESALTQSYPKVEVVVVDDGCPGKTAEIASRYTGVHLLRQANKGLAAARNAGFSASHGEYVVFLDADDRLLPHAVEVGTAELQAHPDCGFAYGACRNISATGQPLPTPPRPPGETDSYEGILRQCRIHGPMTVIYRRSTLIKAGGFSTSGALRGCEDYDMYLRVAAMSPVHAYPEVIAEYRVHNGSMSHNSSMMLAGSLAALNRQAPNIRGQRKYEEARQSGIQMARWYYGGHLANEIRCHLRSGNWKSAALGLAGLLRHHPRGLAEFVGRERVRRLLHPARFGTLRRTKPLSQAYGSDRGKPVDRYYIEGFLSECGEDIHGRVLEVMNSDYTRRFGNNVSQSDVLDIDRSNANATIFADLTKADTIPSDTFDCFILTQTLQYVFDLRAAIDHAYRILRPGGVLLCTVPVVSRIDPRARDSEYWRFTERSCEALFGERFGQRQVSVRAYGNTLTGIAFLAGVAAEELAPAELNTRDSYFPILIAVRGVKS